METVHTETIDGIQYTLEIEPDEIQVQGNALASGDDAEDKAYEDSILERLDNGDTWAWAQVKVTASIDIEAEAKTYTFQGSDYLGACSYTNTAEFIQPGGYWDDMKAEALTALQAEMQSAVDRGDVASKYLQEVE